MSELVKCTQCAEHKPPSAFHKSAAKRNGLMAHCKVCDALKGRTRRYGITKERFEEMWGEQGGKCSVCSDILVLGTRDGCTVDHNHTTGEVRGLLCGLCNKALGLLKDSPSILEAAIAYLREKGTYERIGCTTAAV